MKWFIPLLAASAIVTACGSSSQQCVVLQNGNQVCGTNAAAWCLLTDPQRQDPTLAALLPAAEQAQLQQTQKLCNQIELAYPAP